MNAVEIEEAVSKLAEAPFDAEEFPFAFLEAFGNKETTLKKLRTGNTNQSDVGGLLQRNNIHLKVAPEGKVAESLTVLRDSVATGKHKAKFILATDGVELQAEQLGGDVPPLACAYKDLPNHFAFFLPLAGITTVRQIAENAFDIRATGRLNRLYVELLKTNPGWDTAARREELNHFFARLIFCFFAEDTGIFDPPPAWTGNPTYGLFTATVEQMTDRDGSNTHEVLATLFTAMNTPREQRATCGLPASALRFHYVNGNLFSGTVECPKFSKIARSYLLFVGGLDWKKINPDIFGSMIQAVADDEERGALGMHYTSVPNILKVLNPLFLDDLRQKLAEAGDGTTPASKGQLKRLRDRLSHIRVFDPACGSGNFLVIAYKEMRKVEAVLNERRGERDLPSVIPMTNFRGIEIRHFAAEIARLALIIAKFQCDFDLISPLFARGQALPLDKDNWITRGNALRLDWLQICPPTGTGVKVAGDDLFNTPKDQIEIDFENAGGETYICGNPPYLGRKYQSPEQKSELKNVFGSRCKDTLSLDYVSGWLIKAADYMKQTPTQAAFVCTNSICQGIQVPSLWPTIRSNGTDVAFAYNSFHWSNLASHNAGVTVSIIGLTTDASVPRRLYTIAEDDSVAARIVPHINAYLVAGQDVFVTPKTSVPDERTPMQFGNHPYYANELMLRSHEKELLLKAFPSVDPLVRPLYGSKEFIDGNPRFCLWIDETTLPSAMEITAVRERIEAVRRARLEKASDAQSLKLAATPHRFRDQYEASEQLLIVPIVSSESRQYLPIGIAMPEAIVHNKAFALYDSPLWNMSIVASRLHRIWIGTVCARLRNDPSYSNTLGWNTFPVPSLSDQNKADLTRCAEEILLAREAHFPATIADLYDPENMPADLKAAHDRNDETLERIYIGRRFKNDTERLEKLFEMYTQMTSRQGSTQAAKGSGGADTLKGKAPAGRKKKGA